MMDTLASSINTKIAVAHTHESTLGEFFCSLTGDEIVYIMQHKLTDGICMEGGEFSLRGTDSSNPFHFVNSIK